MRIKICGITNVDDASLAAQLGADAIGLNFFPRSPRHVSEATATDILKALPPFVEPVGLFVNASWDEMQGVLDRLRLVRTVQWHGDHHEAIPPSWPFRVVAAFATRDADSLQRVEDYLQRCTQAGRLPDALLLDGHAAGVYGGTGQHAPWTLLQCFRPAAPVILAGGLTADNVAQAIRIVRPYAVDVASGVEASPGKKDPDKLRHFITNARGA